MKKIIGIISLIVLVLAGCGNEAERGISTDPNEFPSDLQVLENGGTIETYDSETSFELDENSSDELVSDTPENDDEMNTNSSQNESNDSAETVVDQSELQNEEIPDDESAVILTLVLNTNSMKAHCPDCSSVDDMKPSNRQDFTGTVEEVIEMGYTACQRCHPF